MLVSLMQFFLTFGALCLLLSNQVIESEVLFLFIFSVVGYNEAGIEEYTQDTRYLFSLWATDADF